MKIIYRISDTGYKKEKPAYINNENCLINALWAFPPPHDWLVIADNVGDETRKFLSKFFSGDQLMFVSIGHGAGTFNLALTNALRQDKNETIYFLENDYLHLITSPDLIDEGISELCSDYVSLYDHPDKYIPGARGGNPLIGMDGGEVTKVFKSTSSHWKLTNSTTMTFAAKVETLLEDESVMRKWTLGTHPNDFQMFLELRDKGRTLITPLPGAATHGETAWLTSFVDWTKVH